MLAGRGLVVPVDSPALISQSRRKILPAKILPATGGASASDIGCAAADVEGARHSAACRSVCRASHGRVFWARFARDQIAKASSDFAKHDRLEAAWESER